MNIHTPKGLTMEEQMNEDRKKLVARVAKKLSLIESHLYAAITGLQDLDPDFKKGYQLGMLNGTDCMVYISKASAAAGKLAEVQEVIYPVHAELTDVAQEHGVDSGGPYAVLKAFAPKPGTPVIMGGGDR